MSSKMTIRPSEPIDTVAGLLWAINNAVPKDQGSTKFSVRVTMGGKIKAIEFIFPDDPSLTNELLDEPPTTGRFRPDGPYGG
jgi:hypothetical protein